MNMREDASHSLAIFFIGHTDQIVVQSLLNDTTTRRPIRDVLLGEFGWRGIEITHNTL